MPRTEKEKMRRKELDNTPEGKLIWKISNWKQKGLKCKDREEYEYIYWFWFYNERCENCNCEYTIKNKKCMDHNHETGLFRNILCNACNTNLNCRNKSGIPNISWFKLNKCWRYVKQVNGKQYSKCSKDLEWLKNYKKEFELKHIYIH